MRHRCLHQHRYCRVAVLQVAALLGCGACRRAGRRTLEFLHHGVVYLGRLERREARMLLAAERFPPARADWIQASISAALLFMLYALTAPRTVALGDDGLLLSSSYFHGGAQPPG